MKTGLNFGVVLAKETFYPLTTSLFLSCCPGAQFGILIVTCSSFSFAMFCFVDPAETLLTVLGLLVVNLVLSLPMLECLANQISIAFSRIVRKGHSIVPCNITQPLRFHFLRELCRVNDPCLSFCVSTSSSLPSHS